jgi:hypothetical protein
LRTLRESFTVTSRENIGGKSHDISPVILSALPYIFPTTFVATSIIFFFLKRTQLYFGRKKKKDPIYGWMDGWMDQFNNT